jgi:hypothetical protein
LDIFRVKNEPITSLKFHPYKEGVLYVATLHEMRMQDYLFPDGSYDRPEVGRLYRTVDNGKPGKYYLNRKVLVLQNLVFSLTIQKIIASTHIHGIIMSSDGGHSFKSANKDCREIYASIPLQLTLVIPMLYILHQAGEDMIMKSPWYLSTNQDGGNSWNIIKDYGPDDFTEYPTYIRTKEHIGWAISKILVDKKDSSRLFMSNWYGVSVSNDGGKSWSGNNFQGTETVCIENLVVDNIKMDGQVL